MKRIISFLLIFILTLSLMACGKKGDSKSENEKKIKIVLMYPEENLGSIYKEVIKEYEKNNPGVKVEVVLDFSDEDKIKEALTKEDQFDIIGIKRNQLIEYAKTGLIEDLSGFVEKNDLRTKLFPISLSYGTYNGKIYGIGDLPITIEWFYNKNMFEKYGLKEPQNLKDLINISEKLKSKDIIPISIGAMDRWTLALLFGNITCQTTGIHEFTNSLGGEKDAYKNIMGMNDAFLIYNKIAKNAIKKNSVDINFMQSVDDFVKGKAAILPAISITKQLIDSKKSSGFEYGVFENPIYFTDNPIAKISASGGQILTISSKSSNKEEAEKFLNYLLSEDAQKKFVEKGYVSPLKLVNQPETNNERIIISHIEATDENSAMLIDNMSIKMAEALGIVLSDMIEGRVSAKEAWNRVLKITFQQ